MKYFKTADPDDGSFHNIEVYENEDETGEFAVIDVDYLVIKDGTLGETDTHIQAEIREDILSKPVKNWTGPNSGWVRKLYVGPEIPSSEIFTSDQELNEEIFVRACVRTQLLTASGGDNSKNSVAAEFLIAMALLFSKLEDFDTRIDGTDSIGPFQLTSQRWQHFLDENPDSPLDAGQRISHYNQITGAAYLIQELASDLIELAGDDKDFMPTFLNVLHAWLLGPEMAMLVDKEHKGDNQNQSIKDLIKDKVDDFQLVASTCALIMDIDNSSAGVDEFVEKTSDELLKKLKTAFTKVKTHAPEYIRKPGNTAPWWSIAQAELAEWPDTDSNGDGIPDMTETTDAGIAKTVAYFQSIIPGISPNQPTPPWCAAFTSFCMDQAGSPFKESIPKLVPEGARNWRNWGNMSIPMSAPSFPVGAVVLIGPSKESSQIGHVTFYQEHLSGSKKIKCVGGNQGKHGRVKVSTFELSRVVGVRWYETASQAAPSDTDMVVAMTIYGEARNQNEEGRKAVANVIKNRVEADKAHFGGNSIRDVCLKPSQFSCWNNDDPNRKIILNPANHATALFQECLAVAQKLTGGTLVDNTDGATHYYANYIAKPSWLINNPNNPRLTVKHGVHLFYISVDWPA